MRMRWVLLYGLLAFLLLASVGDTAGAPGGPAAPLAGTAAAGYDLSWWTVDGGGGTFSSGDGYSLGGTAGQPDAGVLANGSYTLGGGFWTGGARSPLYGIYLPLVTKND